jgi:outer membrane receptor protein involved in Fe transport
VNSSTKFSLSSLVVFSLLIVNSFGLDKHGTTGKITGRVTEVKDKTPLVGAAVKVEGIFSGAITDDNGEYTILNIDVGNYTVTASYIGYEPEKVTDVKVSADITSTVNFFLKEAGSEITTQEVQILGKRNAISPDQSGRIIDKDFIENTGIRGIENLTATTAGVVEDERGTAVNIRGGRVNETAVIIDGVLTTNPLDGKSTQYVSNNSLEEIAVLTGGFSAEYGNIMSGVINVTTKSGTNKFSGTLEGVTDEIMANDISQGYNVYNAALGGPLIPTKKLSEFANFFAGYESDFSRVANPSWISDQLELPNNILPDYTLNRWAFNAKLNFDLQNLNHKLPIQLKFGTGLTNTDRRVFAQTYMMFNSQRNPLIEESSNQYYGKINHQINSNFFYEMQFNYFDASYIKEDPQFKGNIYSYGDPAKVEGLEIPGGGIFFDEYGVMFKHNRVNNYYQQSNSSYWGLNLNSTCQLKNNEFKFGGDYSYNTINSLMMNPTSMYSYLNKPADEQLNAFNGAMVSANYYGYVPIFNSVTGMLEIQESNSTGFNTPKHPIIGGLYVLDKVEFKDFTMNVGIRWDYLNANSWRVNDLSHTVGENGVLGPEDFNYDNVPASQFSPRIGLSFPVSNSTIFHAQYGKFIQMPSFEFLYTGYESLINSVNTSFTLNTAYGNPNLKPEKTIAYEIGVKQQIGDKLFIDLTTYYKETEDLIGIQKYPQLPNQLIVYENKDYGTIRGTDLQIDLRRSNRLALNIAIGIAFASGTGSDPNSGSTAAWLGSRQPKLTYPLDYDQRFTGVINADYRFGNEDVPEGFLGAILSQLGFNLLYNFNSGRPYTRKSNEVIPFNPTAGGYNVPLLSTINGAYKPWSNRVDLRIDKTLTAWEVDLNLYVYIINLLNSELINEVWDGSGSPGSTGYLSTDEGHQTILSFNDPGGDPPTTSEEFIRRYTLRSKDVGNYGPPRQYRFGIKMNF